MYQETVVYSTKPYMFRSQCIRLFPWSTLHWNHMSIMGSEIIGALAFCWTACSNSHQRKHQSSALLSLCKEKHDSAEHPLQQRASNTDVSMSWYNNRCQEDFNILACLRGITTFKSHIWLIRNSLGNIFFHFTTYLQATQAQSQQADEWTNIASRNRHFQAYPIQRNYLYFN